MNLVGIGKTRGDQNLALYGIPAVESRCAKVAVAVHPFRDRHGNLGNALGYEVLIRDDCIILREDTGRQQKNDSNTQESSHAYAPRISDGVQSHKLASTNISFPERRTAPRLVSPTPQRRVPCLA